MNKREPHADSSSKNMYLQGDTPSLFGHVLLNIIKHCYLLLSQVWSVTGFKDAPLQLYAHNRIVKDTRRSLLLLGFVFAGLMLVEAVMYVSLFESETALANYSLLAVLSINVGLASRQINDLRSLYLLGMTLLVISGTAFVLMAQQSGRFDIMLFASTATLFMVVPLLPWGLREGLVVTGLIYATFTLSTWSMWQSFAMRELVMLQFLMFSSSLTSLILVARNTQSRRDDMQSHYELEQAHRQIMLLSNKDPLTGAWNRRYFNEKFEQTLNDVLEQNCPHYFCCLDIDNFKQLNDNHGHELGDKVLQWLTRSLEVCVGEQGVVIRLGGDEFALLYSGDKPEKMFELVLEELVVMAGIRSADKLAQIGLSAGIVCVKDAANDHQYDIDSLYKKADMALYKAKEEKYLGGRVNTQLAS